MDVTRHRGATGRSLIEMDLGESIASVRPLFRGARLAALDERIQRSLTSPQLVEALARLSAMPHGVALNAAH